MAERISMVERQNEYGEWQLGLGLPTVPWCSGSESWSHVQVSGFEASLCKVWSEQWWHSCGSFPQTCCFACSPHCWKYGRWQSASAWGNWWFLANHVWMEVSHLSQQAGSLSSRCGRCWKPQKGSHDALVLGWSSSAKAERGNPNSSLRFPCPRSTWTQVLGPLSCSGR